MKDQNGLSVAIMTADAATTHPGVMITPGHPEGCECPNKADVNLIIGGGITLRQVLELAELTAQALRENTIEDPVTKDLYAQ